MVEPLYDAETAKIVQGLSISFLRDHISRVLGPSPFDFRGRHIFSKKQAEDMADVIVKAMEEDPQKASEVLDALYSQEES